MTSHNQGLSSNDKGRQKRESLGTRLCRYVKGISSWKLQYTVYERVTFSVKSAIKKEKDLDLGTEVVYHLLGETGWSIINGTRQIPNRNFHGDALVPLPQFFPEGRIKGDPSQKAWN